VEERVSCVELGKWLESTQKPKQYGKEWKMVCWCGIGEIAWKRLEMD
jgi:hypothetical protein